jgi:hypothetical protein
MAALSISVVLATIFFAAPPAKADPVTFCGVNSGKSTSVAATCTITGGATVSGTATEVVTATSDTITLTNLVISDTGKGAVAVSGSNVEIAWNTYHFSGGQGSLWVAYEGNFSDTSVSNGTELVGFSASANTFSNSPATAGPTKIPKRKSRYRIDRRENTKHGVYEDVNTGVLSLLVTYSLQPGETLNLSAEAIAATPESPACVYLLLGIFAICGATLLRSRNTFGRGTTA